MAYPATSDFTSATDDGAYWLTRVTDASGTVSAMVCSTNGRSFVDEVQTNLGVAVDGKWGPNTSIALLAKLRSLNATDVLVNGVSAEQSLRRVGPLQVRGAIFMLHALHPIGDVPAGIALADINLPSDAILPTWDVATPLGPSGDVPPTCVAIQAQSPEMPLPEVPAPVPSVPTPGVTPSMTPTVTPSTSGPSGITAGAIMFVTASLLIAAFFWANSPATSTYSSSREVRSSEPRPRRSKRRRAAVRYR